MSTGRSRKLSKQVLDEAAEWFVELNHGIPGQRVREEFDSWLRTSPQHMQAYLQIASHWESGATRPPGTLETVDELVVMARADRNVVPLPSMRGGRTGAHDEPAAAVPRKGLHRRAWRLAIAASVLVLAASGLAAWNAYSRDTFATGIGENRSLRLSDGSIVELNSKSRLRVRYSDRARRIDLLEGQALFSVQKLAGRPFVVVSGDTRVRAVGTQFDVHRKASGTTVTVVEGRVSVSRGPRQEAASPVAGSLLAAGQQVTVTEREVGRPKEADVVAATAWKDRRLVFTNSPLSEVVAEFNRYNVVPLEVVDPALEQARISGSFSSSDPAALLKFLREVGAYKVEETGGAVRISAK